jgi:hypothetical protein
MEIGGFVAVVALAALVLVPLAHEYVDLRRLGLRRVAAFGATSLVMPAFAVAVALASPLVERPALQWVVTVGATLVLYSTAVRAVARPVRANR